MARSCPGGALPFNFFIGTIFVGSGMSVRKRRICLLAKQSTVYICAKCLEKWHLAQMRIMTAWQLLWPNDII